MDRGAIDRTPTESYSCAACMFELLMVKRGILQIPDNSLTSKDINDMLYSLCIAWY